MPRFATANGNLYFEQQGSRAATPVLLIHGVGCQLIHWPQSFIDALVQADYRVIYFDNRDCGLSFDIAKPPPAIETLIQARENPNLLSPPYTLSEMAMDAVHLLNHIGQSGAHVIGVSMGGMIAQRLITEHSHRAFSMTSIMSTTGNPEVGIPEPEAVAALASNFLEADRETAIQRSKDVGNILGGSAYVSSDVGMARLAEEAYDRAFKPQGTLRQFSAILSDGDRREVLSHCDVPVLAVHGNADPLVNHTGSEDLIETVPNGELMLVNDMGHDLPEPLISEITSRIIEHLRSSYAAR